jgi:hypothetical protein
MRRSRYLLSPVKTQENLKLIEKRRKDEVKRLEGKKKLK